MMDLRKVFDHLPRDVRSLWHECKDVFVAESGSSAARTAFDGQALIDELEQKVQEGFRGLTDERAASNMALLESLFDLWHGKYIEVQTLAEDDISQKRYLDLFQILNKRPRHESPSQMEDVTVSHGKNRGGKLSVTVVAGLYHCKLKVRPFMSLEVCHSLQISLVISHRSNRNNQTPQGQLKKLIELVAHKPCYKPLKESYSIDLHLYAESDPIFASRKHQTAIVAQDSYSFTENGAQRFISTVKRAAAPLQMHQVLINQQARDSEEFSEHRSTKFKTKHVVNYASSGNTCHLTEQFNRKDRETEQKIKFEVQHVVTEVRHLQSKVQMFDNQLGLPVQRPPARTLTDYCLDCELGPSDCECVN